MFIGIVCFLVLALGREAASATLTSSWISYANATSATERDLKYFTAPTLVAEQILTASTASTMGPKRSGSPSMAAASGGERGERDATQKTTWKHDGRMGNLPEFSGTTDGYKEYRKKVELYAARMRGLERETTVGLDLMQGLKGRAWEAVEDLD